MSWGISPANLQSEKQSFLDVFLQKSIGDDKLTDLLSGVLHGLAKTIQAGLVAGVVTVRKVESGGVKTGMDQLLQLFDFPAGRSEGAKDLGGTILDISLVEDHVAIDLSTGKFRSSILHFDSLFVELREKNGIGFGFSFVEKLCVTLF